MEWTELSIYTSSEGVELLCGKLLELGINGFAVEDARDFEEFLQEENRAESKEIDQLNSYRSARNTM